MVEIVRPEETSSLGVLGQLMLRQSRKQIRTCGFHEPCPHFRISSFSVYHAKPLITSYDALRNVDIGLRRNQAPMIDCQPCRRGCARTTSNPTFYRHRSCNGASRQESLVRNIVFVRGASACLCSRKPLWEPDAVWWSRHSSLKPK